MPIASDNPGPRLAAILTVAALLCSWLALPASAQRLRSSDELEELRGVDVVEKLGEQVPLDLEFVNAEGESQPLSRYINGSRPTIVVMVYFDCPMICPVVLDKLHAALNELDYVAGRDFSVLVVSFDPTDTTTHASDRKLYYLSGYTHGMSPDVSSGWQFMTGRPASIRALKDALGFQIRLLDNGEYSHPVALAFTTPDGTIARYIYGLDYDPDQIRLSLLEASDGKIAKSLGEKFIFRCFRYNESEGRYTLHAMTLMRFGGALTVALLVILIGGLFLKNRVRSYRSADPSTSHPTSRRGFTPAHTGSHA
ncbi:MAG: SCO family protein [Phycisphaerales bacterium JB040]